MMNDSLNTVKKLTPPSLTAEHLSALKKTGINVKGEGPAIVFLHSSLSSSKQWQPLISLLSDSFRCINIDLLGYGRAPLVSDPDNYTLATELERIFIALEQVIGDQPFHLVGHSFGGANALKIAVENPKRILSLSLYEPVAFHLLEKGTGVRARVLDFAETVASLDAASAARHFTDMWNSKGFFDSLPKKMQTLMSNDIAKVNLDFVGLISEQYGLPECQAVTCPVTLIHGSQSPDISREIIDRLANSFSNVVEYEIEAGHMAPISHAEQVANIINDEIRGGDTF